MTTRSPQTPHPTTGLSRRGLLHGTAWAVPAITLATAAPSYATSGTAGNQLRVTVVEAKWRDVTDEYVRLRLSVTNLAAVNAGALSLQFTFRGAWVGRAVRTVAVRPTTGISNWGPHWSRPRIIDHVGVGDQRHATIIFTLASLPRMTTSGELDVTFNSTNPRIYGDTTPIEITETTIPRGFTMALDSATQIVPTT